MAKVKAKSKLRTTNKILFIVFIILLIGTILMVALSPNAAPVSDDTEVKDVSVLETPFAAGTYAGINFGSIDDVVKYYNECYDYTKTLTSEYKNTEDGKVGTYYKFMGSDDLQIDNILIDGSENSMINKLVPSIAGGLFTHSLNGLSPSTNRHPKDDVDIKGESLATSRLVADDILDASVVDNKDGTITITLQPKVTSMSTPGMDSQGHVFITLGDIGATVDGISALTWSTGTTEENCKVNYMGGTAILKIDTKTKEVIEADFHEVAFVTVSHANIAVLKDKNASLRIRYDSHYPASKEYLAEKNLEFVK